MPPCVSKACRKTFLLPAYSLIELLAVMAILMILAGIAISGISDSSHNARRISREIVRTHLQHARAHAITTRNHTALIIPVRSSGNTGLRAISLIEVEQVDGRYQPIDHDAATLVQRWTILPRNFHFVENIMIEWKQPTVVDHEQTITIHRRGKEIECHMIVFAPNGQIATPSAGTPIHIAIAQVARNGNAFRIIRNSSDKPVFDLLLVNRLTAKTRNIMP